jgi:integrase
MTTIKVGNTSIKIYHSKGQLKPGRKKERYDQFKVAYYADGQRIRETFGTLAKAKARAHEIAVLTERGERDVLKLSSADRGSYLHALELLKPMSVPLGVAVEAYVAQVQSAQTRGNDRPVGEIVTELLADKKQNGSSIRYVQSLRSHLTRFANAFHCNIGSITAKLIEQWLVNLKVGPRARNNIRMSVVTLFHYARKHGYLPKDEQTEADLVDKVKDRGNKIELLKPAQMARLMAKAQGKIALYLALAGFTGIRAAELLRLEWKDFNFVRGHIEVGVDKAKTATRRLVPILPNLAEYLRHYHRATGRLFKAKDDMRAVAWAKKNGIDPWPINCLRHSFASYRLAATADAARVALELGNSPAKLFSNYRELTDEHDAAAWFAIAPKPSKKIIHFAAAK